MHFIQQVTHFIPIIFEAQLLYLATCFRSTSNSALSSRMNIIRMDKLTYVKDLKLAETQKLSAGLVDADPHFDNMMMLGEDFNTCSTKTEQLIWKGLTRTPLQNFLTGDTSGLTHFTIFTVLPLERMMDFLIKRELNSKDFPFCGQDLPINLSLNARSAVLFFQFNQNFSPRRQLGQLQLRHVPGNF